MRNSKYTHITVGGVDYSAYARLPLTIQRTLNEQLDSAVVDLFNMPFREPLKPFDLVTVGDETYILAEDTVTEVMGRGLYKHSLTLLEQTKETERIICGAKAFTRPLARDYTDGKTKPRVSRFWNEKRAALGDATPSWKIVGDDYVQYPMRSDTLVSSPSYELRDDIGRYIGIAKLADMLLDNEADPSADYAGAKIYCYYNPKATALNAVNVETSESPGGFTLATGSKEITPEGGVAFFLNASGQLPISDGAGVYTVRYEVVNSNNKPQFCFVYDVVVVDKPVKKDVLTIADVINRLLDTAETLRKGDSPRYALPKAVAESPVMKQEAPEFHFANGRSLWENLREIGRYIHAIPRVKGNELTFDDLGGVEYADLSKGQRIAQTSYLNVAEYTAGLDSMANNLINQDDPADGSVTDPFDGGYITMRASSEQARIEEGTGLIPTANPVEKVIKLEVAPFSYKGKNYPAADLTAYVFEKQEYDILSSFSGVYPLGRSYALYYTQGGKNVEGFWFKAQNTGSNLLNSMNEYSITNILERETGVSLGYFKSLPYTDLAFRITYIPSVTARVRQYKPDYDGAFPSVMVHNQSANKLSARAFGENLRGQLAMIGTITDSVAYMFQRVEDIPKPGTLYNDTDYISAVTARIYNDFVLAQIDLSTGYNEIGAYVETPNAIRQFEIPASEDRYTVLEEFCVVSSKPDEDDARVAATSLLKSAIINGLQENSVGQDASLALVNTYDYKSTTPMTESPIALPVTTLALGNSLYFGFRFEDNYSAGRKSAETGEENVKFRYQEHVPYGDRFYAEAQHLGFSLVAGASMNTSAYARHALPEGDYILNKDDAVVSLGAFPILWHKDSADAGCITYQLHFVTDSGFIIGDGLAHFCKAVRKRTSTGEARIYFYDHRIHQLTGTTDTDGAIASNAIGFDEDRISVEGEIPESFKSWAIIKNGRFVLGKNTTEATPSIYFNFKRRYKS